MQTFDEKCEALKSVLSVMWAYYALHERAMKTGRYYVPEPPPGMLSPAWLGIDCNGVCPACEWQDECQGDVWELVYRVLSRRYRINTVAAAFAKLSIQAPQLATAVRAVYVEPYDPKYDRAHGIVFELGSEPVGTRDRKERQRWADAGVRYMARKVRGEVPSLWEHPKPLAQQIKELVVEGHKTADVAQRVGCSAGYVRRIKRTIGVRPQATISALDG